MKKLLLPAIAALFISASTLQPQNNSLPFCINTTINGNPATQMGVAWFTNTHVAGSVVQVAEGVSTFSNATETPAVSTALDSIQYKSGEKRLYTSNKALITNLKPNTTYSYRVGKEGAWSTTGTFTTAKGNKDPFTFIYITDTQANTVENFEVSKTTVETAYNQVPDAKFILITGDMIDSAGERSVEWEWEQWFGTTMQHVSMNIPLAPTVGNHDASPYRNFYHHFHTNSSFPTTMGGTVYSFVYGDALFMVISYEDYRKGEEYFSALEQWMKDEVKKHSDTKWKIAAFHKTMYTGGGHQNDSDGKLIRERFAPVFQNLKIDLAIQGHDHVYEVIGLGTTVSGQTSVEPTPADGRSVSTDVTGKRGGTFDVSNGVLYFLNNSAGKKKYYPRSQEQMEASFEQHGVENFFNLFHKFGQTGEPTFSKIRVATEAIDVETYTVSDDGKAALFDAFRVVKNLSK